MKSTDLGESWEVLNEGLEIDLEGEYSTFYAFAPDRVFPDTMFIGIRCSHTEYGFYRTHNGGENWQIIMEDVIVRAIAAENGRAYASVEGGGLFASFDGGDTWRNTAPTLPWATHILFDSEHLDTLYVGTYGNGLYRSGDGGLSFEHIAFSGKKVTALDLAGSDSCRLIIAAIGYEDGDSVFVSHDNGASWTSRNHGLPHIPYWGPVKSLLISLHNLDVLYAGTTDGVYKSVDQGLNWFPMNEGLEIPTIIFPEPERIYVLTLAMDPDDANILYAGTDGMGLFRTTDGGESWLLVGIPATYVTGLSVSPLNPELVYAGARNGFHVRRNGRWTPTTLWGGITSGVKSVASSPLDSNLVIATYRSAIFTPVIYKSTDGGKTWEITQVLFDGSEVFDLVFDPAFPTRVYGIWGWDLVDTGGLLISDDSGDTWEIVELDSVELRGEIIKPLAINPHNTDELYLLARRGEVYRSADRALTWAKVRAKTDTGHYAIALDPLAPENIYLGTYGVWRSPDRGKTWTRTGLNEWVLDVAFDENNGYLYAVTYGKGVFFTSDGGETWDSLGVLAHPYLRVIDIGEKEKQSIIYVGSFGTGVFEWSEEMTPAQLPEIIQKPPTSAILLRNYPNPFNARTRIQYDVARDGHVSLNIYNVSGQQVKALVDAFKHRGHHQVIWDGRDSQGIEVTSGIYFIRFKAGSSSKTIKMVLLR